VTFANLEGPLTTEATKTTTGEFAFKGDPSYTEILKDGSVEVVTLANNHANDYGTQGLEDTKGYLEEAGIDYCVNDEICIRDVNGIRMAFIGIYELNEGIECESRVRSTIADAKAQGAQLVIVAFHWGTEKSNQPDDTQQSLAHTAVDCGADLVIGHHPHVLQGIEKYNGKYIVYSLANFCFGGNSAPSDLDTMIFQQTFTVTQDSVLQDDEITIIPCSVSSTEGYNNFQPTPASGSEAERIMERINEYSSQFGQSYSLSNDTQ
jgi:poly-gamma-glutamate synthesis protein (capsule biosynthesis protein)